MQDVSFITPSGRFNFRVAALILKDRQLLMIKSDTEPYYYTVGGRVKLDETAEQAILRETFEETGIRFEIDRLAVVHENFFDENQTGEHFHEIALFFLMKPGFCTDFVCNSVGSQGAKEHLHWIPLQKLGETHLHPEFLKTEFESLCDGGVRHIVTRKK